MVEPTRSSLSLADPAAVARRRRGRNVAMLVVLAAIAALFYAVAMVKLGHPG